VSTVLRLTTVGILLFLPSTSRGEEAPHDKVVYSRYSRTFQPTAYKVRDREEQVQLDRPATKEDVEKGEAIFSFEGLGESRVWKMDVFPSRYRDRHKDSRLDATVWQAEELKVGGKWKRHYGVLCDGQAAVIPASEWDAWWPDAPWIPHQERPFSLNMGRYQPLGSPEYWAITLQGASPEFRPRQADDSLIVTVHFFNTSLRQIRLPATWTKSPQDGGPAMLDAVSLSLRRTPFDSDYPFLRSGVELKPNHTARLRQDGAMRSAGPGETCKLFSFDLHDWYNIESEGYYTLRITIDSKALGTDDESERECAREFTIGKPPVLPSIEEYNQTLAVLGGPDNEARLRKLIKETIKPESIDRQPLPPDVERLLRWSDPVNGLAARIEKLSRDTILVRLKNVSHQPLVVPTGNPRDEDAPRAFEIYSRQGTAPWRRARPLMRPYCEQTSSDEDESRAYLSDFVWGIETDRPLVTLLPGEHCLAFVQMLYEEDTEFKVVLRLPEIDEAGQWSGVIETPPRQMWQTYEESAPLFGELSLPQHFPTLTYDAYSPRQHDPAVDGLWFRNRALIGVLRIYNRTQVRKEFGRRMAAEDRMPMKLLLAAIAGRAGSEQAAFYLLEMAKLADLRTSVNVHAALALLSPDTPTEVPDWLIELSTAALADKRFRTGLEGTDWEGHSFGIRSSEFGTPLWSVLLHPGCETAFPVLLEWAREGHWDAVRALGNMADKRASPILIELARNGHLGSIAALGRTGDRRAIPTLTVLAANPRLGLEAVMALSNIDAKRAVPLLVQMLEGIEPISMEPRHRYALQKLAEIDAERAMTVLVKLLRKVDPSQVTVSYGRVSEPLPTLAEAASQLKAKEAVPQLLEYAQYPEVIEALGIIRDPAALPVLLAIVDAGGKIVTEGQTLVEDPDVDNPFATVPGLGEKAAPTVRPAKNDQTFSPELDQKRLFVAKMALCTWDSDSGLSRLLEMLGDDSLDEWQYADVVEKLADCQDPMAIPALVGVIQISEGHSAIDAALSGLASLKFSASIEGLIECFDVEFREESFNKGDYVTPAIYRNRIAQALQNLTNQSFGADKQQWLNWWQQEGQHSTELK
jgi:PBS lyase HEAT-like repeat-containing protein